MEQTAAEKKYKIWIVILSVVIPSAVVALFSIRLKDYGINVTPLKFLPPIYATINGITALLLVTAVNAVKNGKRQLHERLMKIAIGCSVLFLVMYIAYHMTTEETKFGGEGAIRYVYFFILITHIALSIVVIPLVLISYVRALGQSFERHKKIARITYPLWLYVAVTGVVVYFMISPYYV